MKRIIMAAVALALAMSATSAHAMRLNNGRVLIKEGDPISKLQRHAGRADRWDTVRVCKRPTHGSCRDTGWGTRYQYHLDDRTWIIDEYDGVITRMEWTR